VAWQDLQEEVSDLFADLVAPDVKALSQDVEFNRAVARARVSRLDVEKERLRKRLYMQEKRQEEASWRSPRGITFNGETLTVAAWARRLGVSDSTLRHRRLLGWSWEKTLKGLP
jgi:hypothetical protein